MHVKKLEDVVYKEIRRLEEPYFQLLYLIRSCSAEEELLRELGAINDVSERENCRKEVNEEQESLAFHATIELNYVQIF